MDKTSVDSLEEIAEAGRNEFREYLDKSGVLGQLTRIMVELHDEPVKPDNPLEYIRHYLGAPVDIDLDSIRAENDELRRKNEELEATIDALLNQLEDMRREQDDI